MDPLYFPHSTPCLRPCPACGAGASRLPGGPSRFPFFRLAWPVSVGPDFCQFSPDAAVAAWLREKWTPVHIRFVGF